MKDLSFRLELDDCAKWIIDNNYKRIVVQVNPQDLKIAPYISNELTEQFTTTYQEFLKNNPQPEIYVTQSNSCSVDLIVTQHVSNIDAIIHLGQICISQPVVINQDSVIPILLALGRLKRDTHSSNVIKVITNEIESIHLQNSNNRICIFYDTHLIELTDFLMEELNSKGISHIVDIARIPKLSDHWTITDRHSSKMVSQLIIEDKERIYGNFYTNKLLKEYTHGIYIGNRLSIESSISFPGILYKMTWDNPTPVIEEINVSKTLNKRIALVQRLKDEEELKIGVIITNPLPGVSSIMNRLYSFAKPRRHILYFISMIQTIDECKIGNFDLCDAFVIVNSCTCSTILESLVFNRPIITVLEFELACGFEVEYGKVKWPGTSSHLSPDDLINRRKVSDVSLALIHTRNELLESCSQARANKWSGLSYNKASDGGDDHVENLTVEKGLEGLASSYTSEPYK